jgi:hypothetical protein
MVAIDGLVVMCWPLDPKLSASNLAKNNGFLWAIKIHSMISFGERKLAVPCHKFTAC